MQCLHFRNPVRQLHDNNHSMIQTPSAALMAFASTSTTGAVWSSLDATVALRPCYLRMKLSYLLKAWLLLGEVMRR